MVSCLLFLVSACYHVLSHCDFDVRIYGNTAASIISDLHTISSEVDDAKAPLIPLFRNLFQIVGLSIESKMTF